MGALLIVVVAGGIIIQWRQLRETTDTITEIGTITVDRASDTASDVTDRIINSVSSNLRIARYILEGAREAIENAVEQILSQENCTNERSRELQDEVNYRCKRLSFSCSAGESCAETKSKMRRAENCARARRRINQECYGGGDRGHQTAERLAREAAERCRRLIRENC